MMSTPCKKSEISNDDKGHAYILLKLVYYSISYRAVLDKHLNSIYTINIINATILCQ